MKNTIVLVMLLGAAPPPAGALGRVPEESASVAAPAPDFTAKDARGREHRLSSYRGKTVVLEWLNYDCPFVDKHYRGRSMQALQQKYAAKGVVWLSVISSAPGRQGHYAPAAVEEKSRQRGAAPAAILLDADGALGRLYGAKTTPHLFVIDPKGVLAYAGAVDDRPTTNLEDLKGARSYLSEAVDAALAGRPPAVPFTKAYGCSVKY